MVHGDPDAVADVHVDIVHAGTVSAMTDHDEGVTMVAEDHRPGVLGQDLEQDHPVHLAAAEDREQFALAQRAGHDVDGVAGILDTQGGCHDESIGGRIELRWHMHGDETRST